MRHHIVRAGQEHAGGWSELRHRLWPEGSTAEHRVEIGEMLVEGERLVAFVALGDDGAVIGFAEAALRFDYVNGCETSPVVFLEGIFVHEEHRRQGIAAALVSAAADWGRARGVSEMASDADIANLQSHAMHAALSFEETERVVYFRKGL